MLDTLLRDTDAMSMQSFARSARAACSITHWWNMSSGCPIAPSGAEACPKLAGGSAWAICCRKRLCSQPKRTFTFPWERWLRGPLGLQVAIAIWAI